MLTLLLVVLTAAPIEPGSGAKLLGWSLDGTHLVWTEREYVTSPAHHYFEPGKEDELPLATVMAMPEAERRRLKETIETPEDVMGPPQVDEAATLAVVHDLKTGAEVRYFLMNEPRSPQARDVLKKKFASLPDAAALEAWKKVNGLSKRQGPEGPSGNKAKVLVDGEPKLEWHTEIARTLTFQVSRGADRSIVTTEDSGAATYIPSRWVEVWWDPTGKRALFAVETADASTMDGPVEGKSRYFVLAAPPRIEVVAPARLKAEAERVADLVEKTGYAVSSLGPATKDRQATVIYAGPSHLEVARKLAAALTATVEKLTWKANGELVVAVGGP